MTSYNSKTSIKIPPDIEDETYVLTPSPVASPDLSPMQISAKTARIIAQNDEQFDLYKTSSKPRSTFQLIINSLKI